MSKNPNNLRIFEPVEGLFIFSLFILPPSLYYISNDFCEIASRYVLAKAKMVGLVRIRRNGIGQIAKAVRIAQLPKQHDEQLVPTSEMLHVFISYFITILSKNLYGKNSISWSMIYFPVFIEWLIYFWIANVVNSNRHRHYFRSKLYI